MLLKRSEPVGQGALDHDPIPAEGMGEAQRPGVKHHSGLADSLGESLHLGSFAIEIITNDWCAVSGQVFPDLVESPRFRLGREDRKGFVAEGGGSFPCEVRFGFAKGLIFAFSKIGTGNPLLERFAKDNGAVTLDDALLIKLISKIRHSFFV